MIAVGMLDRKVTLYQKSQVDDTRYGGSTNITYTESSEIIFAHVVWKGGKVDEQGNQMQNNQIVEFNVRNGGIMAQADVEDYIFFDSKRYFIDSINVTDGRKKFLKITTTNVQV